MSSGVLPAVIREQRLIAVARGVTGDTAAVLAEALMDGGIGILEITVEEEAGMGALARLKVSDLLIGAGTVTAIGQAAAAIDAGASCLVSPHHDPSLSAWAANRGVPFIAGALTPTEIHVFLSRSYGKNIYLATPGNKMMWVIMDGAIVAAKDFSKK